MANYGKCPDCGSPLQPSACDFECSARCGYIRWCTGGEIHAGHQWPKGAFLVPKYRNPRTGDIVEQPGDGQTVFYLSHGWEIVGEAQPIKIEVFKFDGPTVEDDYKPVVDFAEAVKEGKKGKDK